nr:DUF1413 domain-containing protein [uncultured Pseudomonas sp.]
MQDIFTSIKAYLYDRATSPLIGAFIVGWSVWNYRFFVVMFSAGLSDPKDKFEAIDLLFDQYTFSIGDASFLISGKIIDGALIPTVIALIYLYAYPLLARPVYEHSLKKQKELRAIKQAQEDQRLLSIEESRELYRRLAQMQSKHQDEIDFLNNQISALNQHIENPEKGEQASHESNDEESEFEIKGKREDEFREHDEFIHKAVEARGIGSFYLNDLFGQQKWSEIPVAIRQSLGKRFKHQVERGDFVGVRTNGKSSGNQQKFFKG